MRHAVILAGGAGTRLWPLSRGVRPKQFLSVVGGKSLLRLAYERIEGVVDPENIAVCTAESLRDAVLNHLPELSSGQVIGEPVGRNSANAVALSCATIQAADPDATIAFLTADHVIEPIEKFRTALGIALGVAEELPDALVTFGIVPTSAHTGLGYIDVGPQLGTEGVLAQAREVRQFVEKPDAQTAERFVASGHFWWNSGMFVARPAAFLGALAQTLPDTVRIVTAAAADAEDGPLLLDQAYPDFRNISVDYAAMEPTARGENDQRVVVVPFEIDWLDVGSWPQLAEVLAADPGGNSSLGAIVMVDARGNIVVSDDPEHLVAILGVSDMIVVTTRDVTMVCPKSQAQRVRDLVAHVEATHGARFS
jgi:mannose-1-phosphate guanylyltransferase